MFRTSLHFLICLLLAGQANISFKSGPFSLSPPFGVSLQSESQQQAFSTGDLFSYASLHHLIDFVQNNWEHNGFLKKLLIGVPIILLFIFLERLIPFKKIPFFRSGFFSDFGWYSVIQNQLLQLLFINYLMQFSKAYHFNLLSSLPIWVQVIIILIVFDFSTYWGHRLLHASDFLWRFHEIHHSSIEIDWLSGLRQHPVDLLFAALINSVIFCLTGADFRVAEIVGVLVMVHGLYSHSNFRNKIGKWQYIFISTEMHRIHHLRDIKYQQSNYGSFFSIWDWMFNTGRYPKEKEYDHIPFGTDDKYPQNFIEGNLHALRKTNNNANS